MDDIESWRRDSLEEVLNFAEVCLCLDLGWERKKQKPMNYDHLLYAGEKKQKETGVLSDVSITPCITHSPHHSLTTSLKPHH
jgi:hypothetical protein